VTILARYMLDTLIIEFCTRSSYLSYCRFKVHIYINPNFMVHTRIDRIYYVTELMQHDFSSAQAIIDFFLKTLLMNILLEITVNNKLYYLNCLNSHKNFNYKK
jgi:hypothetical protein